MHGAGFNRVAVVAVAWGVAVSLLVRGYQFGRGNHHVYLLDPLRQLDPTLFANDWWAVGTLQYHWAFSQFAAAVLWLGVAPAAFLLAHLATVVGLHAAWWRIVRTLGGDAAGYAVSVLLYHAMAAGFGLGMYAFLQDSGFLPSNAAAVLLLWGIALWLEGRERWAVACAAAAGFWHLNYAVAAVGAWGVWGAWKLLTRSPGLRCVAPQLTSRAKVDGDTRLRSCDSASRSPDASRATRKPEGSCGATHRSPDGSRLAEPQLPSDSCVPTRWRRRWTWGLVVILLAALPNVVPAVQAKLGGGEALPLGEFVALYAELRHPHHYDPASWHPMVWTTFLLPMPLAFLAWRRRSAARNRAVGATICVLTVLLFTLVGAGIWWWSTSLVQLSLWRLSVYPKLLTCTLAALWLVAAARGVGRPRAAAQTILWGVPVVGIIAAVLGVVPREYAATTVVVLGLIPTALPLVRRWPLWVNGLALAGLAVAVAAAWQRAPGRATPPIMEPGLAEVAAWARANTPKDALFVTPPGESGWQWHSRRATVVSFKHVPQLTHELPEWRQRLEAVTGVENVTTLAGTFDQKLAKLAEKHRVRPLDELRDVARSYAADFVIAPPTGEPAALTAGDGRWAVYVVGP